MIQVITVLCVFFKVHFNPRNIIKTNSVMSLKAEDVMLKKIILVHQRVRKICTYFCFLKREHKFNCIDIVENIKYSKLARATVGIMPD